MTSWETCTEWVVGLVDAKTIQSSQDSHSYLSLIHLDSRLDLGSVASDKCHFWIYLKLGALSGSG